MSNIIIHKIFAEEVLESMTRHSIHSMIECHLQISYTGSNSPDFLFFSHIKPRESYKSHALNRLGSAMHAYGIDAFYEVTVECIRTQKREDVKELMSIYLFSHLYHWALDKTTHLYIFCRTGNCRGVNAGLHHRFESMVDTIISEKYRGLNTRGYPYYEICTCDEDILKAIACIYVPVVRKVYHHEVKVHDIREALNSRYDVQKLLYDPADIKYLLLKGSETFARKSWAVSGNAARPFVDECYDALNEEHAVWKRPCGDTIIPNASFTDMFNEAIEAVVRMVDKTYNYVEYGADSRSVLELLQDAACDTGMDGKRDMKYFDTVYD